MATDSNTQDALDFNEGVFADSDVQRMIKDPAALLEFTVELTAEPVTISYQVVAQTPQEALSKLRGIRHVDIGSDDIYGFDLWREHSVNQMDLTIDTEKAGFQFTGVELYDVVE